MNPMNQKKMDEVDPLTAHFVAGLVHSYFQEKEEAKNHFEASFEFFKVRHLKIRMV